VPGGDIRRQAEGLGWSLGDGPPPLPQTLDEV
jgi:hypothetical protein